VPFFFKVQKEWKAGEALERRLVKAWRDLFAGTPYEHVMQAHVEGGEPSQLYATFSSRMPKMTKEVRQQLSRASSRHPDNMTDEEWTQLLAEQRRERLDQEREDRRARKKQIQRIEPVQPRPVEWQQRQMDIFYRLGRAPLEHTPMGGLRSSDHVPPRPLGATNLQSLIQL
jgi:hypothetical protein